MCVCALLKFITAVRRRPYPIPRGSRDVFESNFQCQTGPAGLRVRSPRCWPWAAAACSITPSRETPRRRRRRCRAGRHHGRPATRRPTPKPLVEAADEARHHHGHAAMPERHCKSSAPEELCGASAATRSGVSPTCSCAIPGCGPRSGTSIRTFTTRTASTPATPCDLALRGDGRTSLQVVRGGRRRRAAGADAAQRSRSRDRSRPFPIR